MNHLIEHHYWKAVTFLVILILAGSGFWGLRRFNPALFLGEPELIAGPAAEKQQKKLASTNTQSLLLNVNTATAKELETLPNIGPRMAQRIIDYRKERGDFASVDALQNVNGIGEKTLEKLRPFIRAE